MGTQPARLTHDCGLEAIRYYTVPVVHLFSEHFNHTLNRPVSSSKDFDAGLKRAEEEASARLGFDQKFVRVDPSDKQALGVTDEGLENRVRQERKASYFA